MASVCTASGFAFWLLAALGVHIPGLPADETLANLARTRFLLEIWRGGPATLRVTAERYADMSAVQLRLFLSGLRRRNPDPGKRLLVVSEKFLNTPYQTSPLGEGARHPPDSDPLLRFDRVDCTTFIEQSMALARAESLAETLSWLRRIRYLGGRMEYRFRKHFAMAQWLPDNQRLGLLRDITEEVAGRATVWVTKRWDRRTWRRRSRPERWPTLDADDVPQGEYRLPIVPLDRVLGLAARIPQGTLINVVRRDLRSHPTRVTHQGILVVRGDGRWLRHAGRAGHGRVVDEPLERFVQRNAAYRKWTVDGFNLQQVIVDDGHRALAD